MNELPEEVADAVDVDATLIVSDYQLPLSTNPNHTLGVLLILILFVGMTSGITRLWNRWKKSKLSEDERNPAYMYSWY